jgi:hypothetical protein
MAEVVHINPLSAEELARIPATSESAPIADAMRARIAAEETYLRTELAYAESRIAALNVKPSSVWQKDIQGYDATYCMCGTLLAALGESEEPIRVRKMGNVVVQVKLAVYRATPAYRTVMLEMVDGSRHQTLLCDKCAREACNGTLNAERIFLRDMAQWMQEPGGKAMAARNARRVPVFARMLELESES